MEAFSIVSVTGNITGEVFSLLQHNSSLCAARLQQLSLSPYFDLAYCLGEEMRVRKLNARSHTFKESTMEIMKLAVKNFVSDESGQDLIEYALIASAVGLIAVAAMASLSGAISGAFAKVTTSLQ